MTRIITNTLKRLRKNQENAQIDLLFELRDQWTLGNKEDCILCVTFFSWEEVNGEPENGIRHCDECWEHVLKLFGQKKRDLRRKASLDRICHNMEFNGIKREGLDFRSEDDKIKFSRGVVEAIDQILYKKLRKNLKGGKDGD